jgi:hypothetical protein
MLWLTKERVEGLIRELEEQRVPPHRHLIVTKLSSSRNKRRSPALHSQEGCQMDLTLEDLRYRLDQLRLLVTETDDPLAERLVRGLIVELEDRLTAEPSPVKHSPG